LGSGIGTVGKRFLLLGSYFWVPEPEPARTSSHSWVSEAEPPRTGSPSRFWNQHHKEPLPIFPTVPNPVEPFIKILKRRKHVFPEGKTFFFQRKQGALTPPDAGAWLELRNKTFGD